MAAKGASRKKVGQGSAGHTSNASGPSTNKEDERWEFQLLQTRKRGHKLFTTGGSDPSAVGKINKTLKDARSASEITLRRTAIEALIPAAAVGNRRALQAQVRVLADDSEAVRKSALNALRVAAGNRRAEKDGAVAVALAEGLPSSLGKANVETRRAAAAALERLAPKNHKGMAALALPGVDDPDPVVRRSAAMALGITATDHSDVSALAGVLGDPDWQVSAAAIKGLEKCWTDPASKKLIDTSLRTPSRQSDRNLRAESPPSSARSAISFTKFQTPASANLSPSATLRTHALASASNCDVRSPSGDHTPSRGAHSSPSKSSSGSPSKPSRGGRGKRNRCNDAMAMSPLDVLTESCCSGELHGLPRGIALDALARAAEPGDKAAIQAAGARLADVDAKVRHQAVLTIAALAPGDRPLAIKTSAEQLCSLDFRVRGAACDAMATAAGPVDDTQACCHAAAMLEQDDWGSRRGAANVLRQLGRKGDASLNTVFSELMPRLEHPDWSIRRKAVQAVGKVAQAVDGDLRAVKLLAGQASDSDQEVRIAVLEALPNAAPRKCKEAVALATTMSEDIAPEVRLCALKVLEEIASVNRSRSRKAVHAVAARLHDEDEDVRAAAVQTLGSIATGRRTAIDATVERLSDLDERVRLAAVNALQGVAPERRDRALKRTVPLLRHADAGVRDTVTAAIQAMSPPGEAIAIAATATTVARFRRRFAAPRGAGLEEDSSTLDGGSAAASDAEVGGTSCCSGSGYGARRHAGRGPLACPGSSDTCVGVGVGAGSEHAASSGASSPGRFGQHRPLPARGHAAADSTMLNMLLAGDLSSAMEARQELCESDAEDDEKEPSSDTDPEEELSDSETDVDEPSESDARPGSESASRSSRCSSNSHAQSGGGRRRSGVGLATKPSSNGSCRGISRV